MPLSHFAISKAAPKDKPYKLSDGFGLHLLVEPNGSKKWRFRYHFAKREKMIALGTYPATSIADARARRDQARSLLEKGIDPSAHRREAAAAAESETKSTFGAVAAEVLANKETADAAEATMSKNRWLLEQLAAPLKDRPIAEITSKEILDLLKKVEQSGRRETARRLRGAIGTVFRYAIVTLRATTDPTLSIHGALLAPKVKPRAAILDEKKFGGLMRAIDDYDGWPTLRAALKFTALTFARPGEVRGALRKEFDLDGAVWHISAERTKMRRPHDIPLSPQALEVLREIWPLSEHHELIFASIRSPIKPLSEAAMNSALRRMGYTQDEMTAHGFRSSASTILNERGFNRDVIEAALGHQDEDDVRRAYNRSKYMKQRIELMINWANIVDDLSCK
ncbi:MAG: tyrosine-type recombinase/integrase [Rhodoblastus sp.]|nr:tyrosine-type recombinase/integrase [Rhodoblastus sp.]